MGILIRQERQVMWRLEQEHFFRVGFKNYTLLDKILYIEMKIFDFNFNYLQNFHDERCSKAINFTDYTAIWIIMH
jgi:hypothetical protein